MSLLWSFQWADITSDSEEQKLDQDQDHQGCGGVFSPEDLQSNLSVVPENSSP